MKGFSCSQKVVLVTRWSLVTSPQNMGVCSIRFREVPNETIVYKSLSYFHAAVLTKECLLHLKQVCLHAPRLYYFHVQ